MPDSCRERIESDDTMECRACLAEIQDESNYLDLFCAWTTPFAGMGLSIAEDLAKLANIQISTADVCSKKICNLCCNRLQDAINFIWNVQNSDMLLRKHYEDSTILSPSWPKPIQIDKTLSSYECESMEVEIKQEVLSEEEYATNDINNEPNESKFESLEIKIEPEEMTLIEPHTQNEFTSAVTTSQHVEEEQNTPYGPTEYLDEQTVIQDVKQEVMSDSEAETEHSGIHKDCLLCMKAFNTVRGLKAHVISVHSYNSITKPKPRVGRKFVLSPVCRICSKSFSTRTDLVVHETCHRKFACYVCGMKFDSFPLLTQHRRKRCKQRPVLPRLKTLYDVRRIARHREKKTLKLFDLNIPIARITDSENVKKEKRKAEQASQGNIDLNDIMHKLLNDSVKSVIVNVRLPDNDDVTAKKSLNEHINIIPKEEPIDEDVGNIVPKTEPVDEPDIGKESQALQKNTSKLLNPFSEIPDLPHKGLTMAQTKVTSKSHKPKRVNLLSILKNNKNKSILNHKSNKLLPAASISPTIVKERSELENNEKKETKKEMTCKIKRLTQAGIEWTKKDGRIVVTKKLEPLWACRLKCSLNIPEEFRQRFFDYFWSLNVTEQRKFTTTLVECKIRSQDTSKSITTGSGHVKKYLCTYYLKLDTESYNICKGCLINTLGSQNLFMFRPDRLLKMKKKEDERQKN